MPEISRVAAGHQGIPGEYLETPGGGQQEGAERQQRYHTPGDPFGVGGFVALSRILTAVFLQSLCLDMQLMQCFRKSLAQGLLKSRKSRDSRGFH